MLYLRHPGDDASGDSPRRLPLADDSAATLERALIASDRDQRRTELGQALAKDSILAGWALRLAEHRTARTINRADEAAAWLSGRLEVELANALECDRQPEFTTPGEARLMALTARLSEYERKLNDYEWRLEREKLEALKELAYGASHEINNPLANIAARAETLLSDEADPDRARKLLAIHRQALRAHEMISDLMLFARPPKLVQRPFDLRQLANRVVDEQRDLAVEIDVEIAAEIDGEPIELLADETQLGVALQAVLKNALEAVPCGGHVWVAVREIEMGAQCFAEICVRDDGPGISEAVRQHLFDPFYSGREAGRGLGFGLSKCWRIVTDHGGEIVVDRPGTGGAQFSILLPMPSTDSIRR
jgi:signal transduction histidine kinase